MQQNFYFFPNLIKGGKILKSNENKQAKDVRNQQTNTYKI